ncbi:MAG TPA: C13 family peptidase [Rhodanobacteraceae bacterium]|nr:C13 family peptidase [Rhodanobacteraceae bacterium]
MQRHVAAGVVLAALAGAVAGFALRGHLPLPPPAPPSAAPPSATRTVPAPTVATGDAPGDAADDSAPPPADFDAEVLMYDQPRLIDDALATLAPQTPGKVDLYVIAFAGDGSENVFRNEAEYVARLFDQRFRDTGHVLVLENHPATVGTRPLATLTNLIWALDGIAAKMDPAEDVLLLYLTTHGSADHLLLVDLDPLPLDQIGPADLADALHTEPAIRWKVVVVNACYSGGFIDALRDPSTMVITSARADRSSFGCGVDADITWFGKAFLAQALNRTTSFHAAFDLARRSIAGWETAEHEEASEPQIATAAAIETHLAQWRARLDAGAAVRFAPPDPARMLSPQTSHE